MTLKVCFGLRSSQGRSICVVNFPMAREAAWSACARKQL